MSEGCSASRDTIVEMVVRRMSDEAGLARSDCAMIGLYLVIGREKGVLDSTQNVFNCRSVLSIKLSKSSLDLSTQRSYKPKPDG